MVREHLIIGDDGEESMAPGAGPQTILAGEEFPAYARGRWRYRDDGSERCWVKLSA